MIIDIKPESYVRYTDIFPGAVEWYGQSSCAYDRHFSEQARLHPDIRNYICTLVCCCDKCSRHTM